MPAPEASTAPRAEHRRRAAVATALALVAAAALVVALAARVGASGRRIAPSRVVVRVPAADEALEAWRSRAVRGRVLVHFARHLAMSQEPGAPPEATYVLRALEEGIVRRVYHVIPDDAWAEVQDVLASRPGAEPEGEGFRLQKAGAPILVLPRARLPALAEPALVTIEADRWSPDALGWMAARLKDGSLPSDVVVWHGRPDGTTPLDALSHASP